MSSHQAPQSQPPATTQSPAPDPQSPAPDPAQAGGAQQTGVASPLPISPLTGQPYDPAWGTIIQKGDVNPRTIQQIVKPEIKRQTGQ